MKSIYIVLSIILISSSCLFAQENETEEFKPSGKVFGKVFWNYHMDLSDGTSQRHSFALQRTYLGYNYNFSKNISAKITIDGSKASAASENTFFVKNAQLDWKVDDRFKFSGGLIGTQQFNTQEKFWGYRYIYKSLQDEFGFGSSADLGFNSEIKLTDQVTANLFVFNGEGYTQTQDKLGTLKAGGNIIVKPVDGLMIKAYYDIYGGKYELNDSTVVEDTASIHTLSFFCGYQNEKFRLGGEYNIQINGTKYATIAEDHNLTGYTLFGAYTINDKFELFGQWMQIKSNKPDGESQVWNIQKDGNLILAGIEYAPVKGVNMALNYRTFLYDNPDMASQSYIYLNFEFYF